MKMEPTDQGGSGGVIWIKGSVNAELREGVPVAVEGVLIKTNQGVVTYTDGKGKFTCPVCIQEERYALAAFKQGFQIWVDWKTLDREGRANEWDIDLTPGPEGALCELLMMPRLSPTTGPGCIMPKVVDCATGNPIPNAWIKLDSQIWQQTDSSGNGRCLCATAGQHELCARKGTHYPKKCKTVVLRLGETIEGAEAIICLDYVP
jgi:hypothetical protein